MRYWLVTVAGAAVMMTHVAPASGEVSTPAGPDGVGGLGGLAPPAARTGSPEAGFRLVSESVATSLGAIAKAPPAPKLRRIASLFDFVPDEELGIHLSAGMRNLFRRGAGAFSPFRDARPSALIYTPAMAGLLPFRPAMRRNAPAVAVGWMRAIATHALIGIEAGTSFEHGGDRAIAKAGMTRWSRANPVGQASFALRF